MFSACFSVGGALPPNAAVPGSRRGMSASTQQNTSPQLAVRRVKYHAIMSAVRSSEGLYAGLLLLSY